MRKLILLEFTRRLALLLCSILLCLGAGLAAEDIASIDLSALPKEAESGKIAKELLNKVGGEYLPQFLIVDCGYITRCLQNLGYSDAKVVIDPEREGGKLSLKVKIANLIMYKVTRVEIEGYSDVETQKILDKAGVALNIPYSLSTQGDIAKKITEVEARLSKYHVGRKLDVEKHVVTVTLSSP